MNSNLKVKTKQSADLKITSFEDLADYSNGKTLELPSFAEDQQFIAKIKRPSLLMLMNSNEFPNELLSIANSLFTGNVAQVMSQDEDAYKKSAEVFLMVAKKALVQPSYDELEKAGVELTDEQLVFIFNYSQDGVNFLKNFRKE